MFMKTKLQSLTKTILVAAGLCVGAGQVHADEKNYSTVFKQTFEDASTLTTGWTIANATSSQYTIGTNNFLMLTVAWKNGATQYYDFASSVTGITDYQFSFKFGYSPCGSSQNSAGTVLTVYDSSNAELFHFDSNACGNGTTAGVITVYNGETSLGTFNVDTRYNGSPTNVYTVTVTGDETNGVTLAIAKDGGSAVTLSNSTLNASFKLAAKLETTPRGGGNSTYPARMILDDITFGEAVSGAFANSPTFTFESVAGASRNYTISNDNGEGKIYYTTSPAETAPVKGSADYTATTDLSKVVNYTETGNYYAYTELADGSTTSEIETLVLSSVDAIQLVQPEATMTGMQLTDGYYYPIYRFVSDNSGKLGSPSATLKYTFVPASGSSTNGTLSDNKFVFTSKGTLTVTAENEDYTTSEGKVITVNDMYTVAKTYDFTDANITTNLIDVAIWSETGDNVNFLNLSGQSGKPYAVPAATSGASMIDGLNFSGTQGVELIQIVTGKGVHYNSGRGTFTVTPTKAASDIAVYSLINRSLEEYTETGNSKTISRKQDGPGLQKITIYSPVSVNATVTSAGWATLYTAYALDFSGVDGLEAYTATCSESTVTLTKVSTVPAGTGVVLKGAANTYSIPVIANSTTDKGHLLGSATEATPFNAYDGYTLYMLKMVNEKAQFVPMTSGSLAAGKAYLKIASGNSSLARSLNVVFADETTGINSVNGDEVTVNGYFNLSGQRVSQPTKGLYIVNGKKIIVK